MERILDLVDQAARDQRILPENLQAWMIRQRSDQTYVQRLVSMIQRADMEKRPPPHELRSFLFRGQAYEMVAWPLVGYHPAGCVWFPTKEAWLLLRRSPVSPVIALPPWMPTAEHDGVVDLTQVPKLEHASNA